MSAAVNQLVGYRVSPVGTLQVNTDGTAIVDGAKYQELVDNQSFVLSGLLLRSSKVIN